MNKGIIPEAALGQHIAVLGKTGSGKTFAAKAAIVEPLLERGRRVGIVDPTDAWWGLRSSRDGKGPGFPVLVLGGDHGDLPLPANGGGAVARLLVEQRVNLVASTKHLTIGERTRWFIDFAGTVSRLNRSPLHLVLDEAHNFAPKGKVPDPDTGKMLHAANTLASGGRSIGIRLTMITQRPQKLHNDALTSADTLIAMRVLAPHDRLAVEDWIKGCGDMAAGKEVLNSLASLQRGEGWIWYPEGGHLVRARFPQITTFDSSATPQDGHALEAPKGAAEVDLTEIRAALAEAVKEAEANDPKLLRSRIAQLEADLRKSKVTSEIHKSEPDGLAIAAARQEGREEGAREGYGAGLRAVQPLAERLGTLSTAISETIEGFQQDLRRLAAAHPPTEHREPVAPSTLQRHARPAPSLQERHAGGAGVAPRARGAKQRILDALAWLRAVGIPRADKVQLALLADASPSSSGYQNNLGFLRSAGLIDYPFAGVVELTAAGLAAAQVPARAPTTEDLHRTLEAKLARPQWQIVRELIGAYPRSMTREQLARAIDQSFSSSGFQNNLGALRSLGFIDYPQRGQVVAQPVLFLER